MGLDTFPLLEDQTFLITYSSNVYKLKLKYEEISREKKEIFVQVVSERSAHCQIEDVCRAVLYSIEREEKLSPIQTDNFIIYPEVCEWPLGKKVLFIVDGKPLSCYKDLISLRLTCKDVTAPENDQVVVSPWGKKKWPSCKLSHGMSQMRATTDSQTRKTATTKSPNTDESNSHTAVTCVNNDAAIIDTPLPGINNSRGGQSPESSNKITTIIQKHCVNTQLPTTHNEIKLARLSRNKPTQNKMSTESHKSNILSYECTNKRRLTNQERMEYVRTFLKKKHSKLVNLMNTDNAESKTSNCDTSQNDCTQDKDKQINTILRSSFHRAGKVINKTAQKDVAMPLEETQWRGASDDDSKIRLSDSNDGRDLIESSPFSSSQSSNSTLYSSKQSGVENIVNKEKLHFVTRSHGGKKVNNIFMPLEIMISSEKYPTLYTEGQLLRIQADGVAAKSQNAELKKNGSVTAGIQNYKEKNVRIDQTSSGAESSHDTIVKEKYHGHVDEIKQHSTSLEIKGKNVVEISDDGSIVNESETMSYTDESVGSVTRTVSTRGQNRRRNTSSMKYSECDMGRQRKCISRRSSQELNTVKTHEDISNLEQTTQQNVRDISTPAKRQTRSSKAQMRASSSNSGSIKSLNNRQTRRKLERNPNLDSSPMSVMSQMSSSRASRYGHRHTDRKHSTTKTASDSKNSSDRRKRNRLDMDKSLGNYPKISSRSPRIAKECSIKKDSRALRSSKDMKIKKKIATDIDNKKTQSGGIINSSLNSYKRSAKAFLRQSPQESKCSSRTVQSRKSSSSNCSELSSNGAITSNRTNKKFLNAHRQLLKSKDGIWLFWKS